MLQSAGIGFVGLLADGTLHHHGLALVSAGLRFPLRVVGRVDRKIPVAVTCQGTRFFQEAYFVWRADPVSQRDWDNAHVTNAPFAIHGDERGFGYRFIADKIEAESGIPGSERRVWRLCSQQRIWSHFSKKRGLNRKVGPPVHDDLVQRDFTAQQANQLWLTDIPPPGASGGRYPHRASDGLIPSRRGQAVSVRDQRPVVEPDPRLLDRFEDDGGARGRGGAQRSRAPGCRRNDPAFGPRISIPVQEVRRVAAPGWHHRVDGTGRGVR